jgi:ribosomal-protein-alanine N-acetyltransferase
MEKALGPHSLGRAFASRVSTGMRALTANDDVTPTLAWAVGILAGAGAFIRMLPIRLEYEEPSLLAAVATSQPLDYALTPWNGALTLFGRVAFMVAYPFDEFAPLVTRLIAAAVIGAVGGYLAATLGRAGLVAGLSLPLLPIPDPGPFIGPLNSQWWFAVAIAAMATVPARRWHNVALVVAGLSGIGPCLLWPAFRDRRTFALLAPAVVQGLVLFLSTRRPTGQKPDPAYLLVMIALVACLAFARLPVRTRLVFLYAGLAILTAGLVAEGRLVGQGRYLAVPAVGIVIGLASFLRRPTAFRTDGSKAPASGSGRLLRPGDAIELTALFAAIDDQHFHPHPLTRQEAQRLVEYEGRDVYGVLEADDGGLVAYGMLRGWDQGYPVPSLGVAVRADQRGHGYGRLMMQWLAGEARRRGADRIRLRVHPRNLPARRLYAELGYEPSGEERGEIVMMLHLSHGSEER